MTEAPTPDNVASFWAAIAASFAALSSFLIMLIQRKNLIESVRPELVLADWGRESRGVGDTAYEVITFKSIENVGKGAAFHISYGFADVFENKPTAVLSSARVPILAANKSSIVNGEIIVYWNNVKADEKNHRRLPITIRIICIDSSGRRYLTTYSMLAISLSPGHGVMNEIAPGVGLMTRSTSAMTIRFWRIRLWLSHFPGLHSLSRDIEK